MSAAATKIPTAAERAAAEAKRAALLAKVKAEIAAAQAAAALLEAAKAVAAAAAAASTDDHDEECCDDCGEAFADNGDFHRPCQLCCKELCSDCARSCGGPADDPDYCCDNHVCSECEAANPDWRCDDCHGCASDSEEAARASGTTANQ